MGFEFETIQSAALELKIENKKLKEEVAALEKEKTKPKAKSKKVD